MIYIFHDLIFLDKIRICIFKKYIFIEIMIRKYKINIIYFKKKNTNIIFYLIKLYCIYIIIK